MEAETVEPPRDNYLQALHDLCRRHGALLILDEIITGFRWHLGGAQKVYGITPDLATFGKALGNGFSIAALVGRRAIMELGGLTHDRERVFLLSTTFGAETHALAAAMATMQVFEEQGVIEHLYAQGERLAAGIESAVKARGLQGYFGVMGRPCNLIYYTCDENKQRSQAFRTLFLQEMIRRGFLAPSLVVSFSHSADDVDRTIAAVDSALEVYCRALEDGVDKHLVGRPVKPVLRKLN
jgi:glutamate-1-semialdehyde 2,1-aminomutase